MEDFLSTVRPLNKFYDTHERRPCGDYLQIEINFYLEQIIKFYFCGGSDPMCVYTGCVSKNLTLIILTVKKH